MGVERAVAQGLRHEHAARGEVHRLHRLLLPRPGRPVAVHLRRRDGRVRRRRRRPLLRRPQPEPGASVADEVRARSSATTRSSSAPRSSAATCAASTSRTGPPGFYIYSYGGVPYAQYSYGYDLQGDNKRDVRLRAGPVERRPADAEPRPAPGSHPRHSPVARRTTVYKPKASWGPRVGAAYDLTGKGNDGAEGVLGPVLRGRGRGFFYYAATPGVSGLQRPTYYNADGSARADRRCSRPGSSTGSATTSSIPSTDEFNVSFEQQITRVAALHRHGHLARRRGTSSTT